MMQASSKGQFPLPNLPTNSHTAHKMNASQNLMSLSVLADDNLVFILDKIKSLYAKKRPSLSLFQNRLYWRALEDPTDSGWFLLQLPVQERTFLLIHTIQMQLQIQLLLRTTTSSNGIFLYQRHLGLQPPRNQTLIVLIVPTHNLQWPH